MRAKKDSEATIPPSVDDCRQRLRACMPVAERYAYFDHAAVAPLTKAAADAIADYATTAQDCGDVHWMDWSRGVQLLRANLARLLGATVEEIALVNNTTHGINVIAEAYPWQRGDNLVVLENEFPSNFLVWQELERLGVEVRVLPMPGDGFVDLEHLANAIDAKTRLLPISWVGYSSGYRIDVAQVVEIAHRKGCLVLLDAIQGLGPFPLDVRDTQVDFVVADGHKWMLGPEGAGVLYISSQHLDRLRPIGIGWNSLASGAFEPGGGQLKSTAARYEGGSTNIPGMLGLGASVEILLQLGAAEPNSLLSTAVQENVRELESQLVSAGFQCSLPKQEQHRSGILGITWDGATDRELVAARKACLRHSVVTSVRCGKLRVSTHAYNNFADVERLVAALAVFRQN